MEVVKPRSASGMAKLTGVALCLAGVFVIAFYSGPALSPVNHHRAFTANASASAGSVNTSSSNSRWIEGTFLMVLANVAWSLSIVWQVDPGLSLSSMHMLICMHEFQMFRTTYCIVC